VVGEVVGTEGVTWAVGGCEILGREGFEVTGNRKGLKDEEMSARECKRGLGVMLFFDTDGSDAN